MDKTPTDAPPSGAAVRTYSSVVLDLDGTIADSAPGVVRSVQEAFAKSGRVAPPVSELMTWLGPPMLSSLRERAHLDEDAAHEVLALYRTHYDSTGVLDAHLYPGIADFLRAMRIADMPLAVATSKPESPARDMLKHLGVTESFAVIRGAKDSEGRSSKRDVLSSALAALAEADLLGSRPVMIGDRHHDTGAAGELGIASIFAAWGYGTMEEAAGATAIAPAPLDLIGILLG